MSNDLGAAIVRAVEVKSEKILKRELKATADQLRDEAKAEAPVDDGEYRDGIVTKMSSKRGRLPSAKVVATAPHSHLVEYGTEDTPEFAPMAKVALRHGGTLSNSGDDE